MVPLVSGPSGNGAGGMKRGMWAKSSVVTGNRLSSLLLSEHEGSSKLILFCGFLRDPLLGTSTWQVP